jgi:hypothetical protein
MQYAVVGDGSGSRRMFHLTEGVDDSGALSVPGGGGGYASVELSSIACWVAASDGAAESTAGAVVSTAGSSLLTPTSSTWKFNVLMAILNPPVVAEVDPVTHG